MRKAMVTIGFVFFFQAFSFGQVEKEINSSIKKVTVFSQGAQIERGALDADSGKVVWELALNSNESKEIVFKYSVKYPKDKKVIIE